MEILNKIRELLTIKEMRKLHRTHNHQNKWLLCFSTLILISFLLVDHISVVECGLQTLTSSVENETTGKGAEKAKIIFGNNISNGPGRQAKPGTSGGGNEIHSKFKFNDIDQEQEEEDPDSYPDEDTSYSYDSYEDVDAKDADYITKFEEDKKEEKPTMGKCCNYGYGLDVKGACEKINPEHLKHHDKYGF